MRFVDATFDSLVLRVPVMPNGKPWDEWAGPDIRDYPTRCGAGEGIGDKIVPDTIYFLPISVACDIHDICWQIAPATEYARKESDYVFLYNMLTIIEAESNWFMRALRNQRAMVYYNAVDCELNNIFWKLKREQGHQVPAHVVSYA